MSQTKTHKSVGKKVAFAIIVIFALTVVVYLAIVVYLKISAKASEKTYTDISQYAEQRSGDDAIDNFSARGMDEIWPEEITAGMDVQNYFMMSYNPWDVNYLGYLVIDYEETDYMTEVLRLSEYTSTDYIGNYGATSFKDYEVLAMNADDEGFVYAITDGTLRIIYVEMIFPGYGMDIAYEKYIPEEYLPEGLDATTGNPTQQEKVEGYKKTK